MMPAASGMRPQGPTFRHRERTAVKHGRITNMYDRILRHAHVVDPLNHIDGTADVAVSNGRIAAVAPQIQKAAAEEEDCSGLVLMPGLIDPHLHLGTMFGSPYGSRMAALAGVTTCLDMAGPVDDILKHIKQKGAGINVAMLSGFSPKEEFGTAEPTKSQIETAVESAVKKGALGLKIMGGHWPLALSVCRDVVDSCNEQNAYVAWHAGSLTAGSNLKGMEEVIETVKGKRLHLAHINAYCRGRVKSVEAETARAIELLTENPNIWCESYVSPMNGTILTCDGPDHKGEVIDHVTRTCLESFNCPTTYDGIVQAIRNHQLFVVKDTGFVSELIEGDEALAYWQAAGTATAGSFPVNPAYSRFVLAQAKRPDGSFVVDAISTDGGCIPRNVTIAVGLSLVKFGALTLPEFVLKTSVNPARHLRLADRGHLTPGAAADITLFDLERQKAVETIVAGKTVMKQGEITGSSATFITTAAGVEHLGSLGFETIAVDLSAPEPERIHL